MGSHGTAVPLRAALAAECQASKRCLGWDATAEQDNKLRKGVPKSRGVTHRFNDTKLVEFHMDSTFCAEVRAPTFEPVHASRPEPTGLPDANSAPCHLQPMGDSATRKGIIDSIVFGCIPVVFSHRQTTLWLAHVSLEEFMSFAVFVPEAYIIGSGAKRLSVYGKADLSEGRVKGVYLPGGSLQAILEAISPAELHRRQAAMAVVAPRMLIALEDGGCDALDTLFRRMLADSAVGPEAEAARLAPRGGGGRGGRKAAAGGADKS